MLIEGVRPESLTFDFSPVQETLRALHVLAEPRHHAEQMGWVRGARRRLTPALKAELRRFAFLLLPAPELFVDLLPSLRSATFDGELALLRKSVPAFRRAMVRRMLDKRLLAGSDLAAETRRAALVRLAREAAKRRPGDAGLFADFVARPEVVLRDFSALLETFFVRCLAAQWEHFQSQALADASLRKELLQRFGIAAMLRTLTRELTVEGDRRRASVSYGAGGLRIQLPRGAKVALTPSYFIWPHATLVVLKRATLDVRIAYPLASPGTVRAGASRWDGLARRFAALSDSTRLQMLELLARRELSTRELAGLLGLSESGVSRHLSLLRRTSLVSSVRDGYFVLYRRTPDVGEALDAMARIGSKPVPSIPAASSSVAPRARERARDRPSDRPRRRC